MRASAIYFKRAFLFGVLFWGFVQLSNAQFQYRDDPVLQIIDDIQKQTPFRFLYRDALVSDIKLSFSSDSENLFADFRTALNPYELDLQIDSTRQQAIIYQQKNSETYSKKISIRGQVVDASTGERLPFATIIWEHQNESKGVSSNQSGSFTVNQTFEQESVNIKCSYVGYATKTVTLNLSDLGDMHELTFRLQPKRIDGNHLIVTGSNYYSNINGHTSELVDIGTFSPIGESNTLRALQTLPSVSLAPAISDGLHVRNSPTDGFQVLVDDITIYNQSHLFGLVDSFNADILKRSGFFYDIAPAQFQAPPGGTLSLITKTGSLDEVSATAGLSNSSARLSLEGPIKNGSSSWLISGRSSYMNTVNWFNNSNLIEWGLDTGREREVLSDGIELQSRIVRPGETDATFFDLHGKVYFESLQGNRLIISGYFGGDNTQQEAERLYRSFSSSGSNFEFRPVTTTNDWENGAASAQYQLWFSDNIYSNSTIGASIYQTSFSKEDFTYVDINQANQSMQAFVFGFENRSVLNEIKAEQKIEFNTEPWLWTAGVSYHYFIGEYFEDSFDRPGYFSSRKSHKIDAYAQLDFSGIDMLDIFTGVRAHYYTNGEYLKWSPRIKVKLFPDSKLSLSGGYSRNHQFLSQISLSNTVTSDVWILADEDQPPTSVNYFSGGIYFSHSDYFYVQAEGYLKEFENMRLHEINTFSLSNTFNTNPWYINNSATGKGIEFLLQNRFKFAELSQTFTISEMKLSNPNINDGEAFYADWDRTYRYTATLEIEPFTNFWLYLSWMYATGTPNQLATFGSQNQERLGDYQRADITAEYKRTLNDININLSISIFNVTDRQNPWYRELAFVIDQNASRDRLRTVPVNVYDIGLQPSFNITVGF